MCNIHPKPIFINICFPYSSLGGAIDDRCPCPFVILSKGEGAPCEYEFCKYEYRLKAYGGKDGRTGVNWNALDVGSPSVILQKSTL